LDFHAGDYSQMNFIGAIKIAHGSTPAMAYRMGKDLSDGRIVIFDELHHLLPIEEPDQVNAELCAFLREPS
jgi:pimeloyl-ACP methyl ester carboxylesterase